MIDEIFSNSNHSMMNKIKQEVKEIKPQEKKAESRKMLTLKEYTL